VSVELFVPEAPSMDDRAAILAPLAEYNRSQVPGTVREPVAILLKDEAGATTGGLWATIAFDWLVIELLVVPEALRGRDLGSAILARAEETGRAKGCIGAWLDTFSFQARGFYEKQGYSVVGEIRDHPVGAARYFMTKRFG
jgi:GNAT superfamily N-acetyltransferase